MRLDFQRKAEQRLLLRADGSGIKERVGGAIVAVTTPGAIVAASES